MCTTSWSSISHVILVIGRDTERYLVQTNCPSAFLHLDLLAKFAIEDGFLALKTHEELFLGESDVKISRAGPLGNRDHDIEFTKLLLPSVGEGWSMRGSVGNRSGRYDREYLLVLAVPSLCPPCP